MDSFIGLSSYETMNPRNIHKACVKTGRNRLTNIYLTFFKDYGPQGWWPVTPGGKHIPKYGVEKHSLKQKLEIMFGAILTQNTAWKPNVERAIENLNRKDLIDVKRVLAVDEAELAKLIRSAGYYNQKARKLKRTAQFLKMHPIPKLANMETQKARDLLLGVNGIGPETADSMLLYALEKPVFVVDSYTKRILSRYGLVRANASYDEVQRLLMEQLAPDTKIFNEFHALIVEHAKRSCKKTPDCSGCCIRKVCARRIDDAFNQVF